MKSERTRIKICGLTRTEDIDAAIALGVDAIGLVFYPPSPRYVIPAAAAGLVRCVPPFVTVTGLFVNASQSEVENVLRQVPLTLLQFHGDEQEADCTGFGLPYVKAARVRPELDLVEFASHYPQARGLLLDAFVEGYGGGGRVFDWSLIPAVEKRTLPLVLSGGLNANNVAEAITRVRPFAVDVSSGVEAAKGIKDAALMRRFVERVHAADAAWQIQNQDP